MEKKQYQYYAFISYSRKDEKWAKWLQNRIESYKLPSTIRQESEDEIPRNIRPVFRDKTDIGIGDLKKNLKEELDDSKYLIVICSPNSAKSEWVNKEVEHFKAIGKEGHVIPFIVEGTPDAHDPERNCFPPAISPETLGASVEELGKERAFIKIVASILDLKFDYLFNRHKRREKKQRSLQFGALSLLILAIIVALVSHNISITRERNKALLASADSDYKEAVRLLAENNTGKGLAYLARSLRHIQYEPAKQKLNSVLLQKSFILHEKDVVSLTKETDQKNIVSDDLHKIARVHASGNSDSIKLNIDALTYTFPATYTDIRFSENAENLILINEDNMLLSLFSLEDTAYGRTLGFKMNDNIIAYSISGTYMAIFRDNSVFIENLVEDVTSLEIKNVAPLTSENIDSYAKFSDDENYVLLPTRSNGNAVSCFDLKTGKEKLSIERKGMIRDYLFSPMSNHIVITYFEEGDFDFTFEAVPLDKQYDPWLYKAERAPYRLVFSPNGIHLAAVFASSLYADHKLLLFDIFSNENPVVTEIVKPDYITACDFSHDGRRIMLIERNNLLSIHDVSTGDLAFEPLMFDNNESIRSASFNVQDNSLRIWVNDVVSEYLLQKSPYSQDVFKNDFVMSTAIVSNAYDLVSTVTLDPAFLTGTIDFFDINGKKLLEPLIVDQNISCMKFNEKGDLLAVGTGNMADTVVIGKIIVYRISDTASSENGNKGLVIDEVLNKRLPYTVEDIQFSKNNHTMAVRGISLSSKSRDVFLADLNQDDVKSEMISHNCTVETIALSDNGKLLAIGGSDRKVLVRDIEDGTILSTIEHSYFPTDVLFTGKDKEVLSSSRWLSISGEVHYTSVEGEELWQKPYQTNFGIAHLIDSREKVYLISNGNKITALMKENSVKAINNIKVFGEISDAMLMDEVLVVSSNKDETYSLKQALASHSVSSMVEFFNAETSLPVAEPVIHSGSLLGIEKMKDQVLSYDMEGYVLTPAFYFSASEANGIYDDVDGLVAAISGWNLNENSVLFRRSYDESSLENDFLKWLKTPADTRKISPYSEKLLSSKLVDLTKGSYDELDEALDLCPDYIPAINEFWFTAASESAEKDFINSQHVTNRQEYEQAQTKWVELKSRLLGDAIFTNPKSDLIAWFYLQNSLQKDPDYSSTWKNLSVYYKLTGEVELSREALEYAVKAEDPSLDILLELAGQYFYYDNNYVKALDILNRAGSNETHFMGNLDNILSFGKIASEYSLKAFGLDSAKKYIDQTLERLKDFCESNSPLTMDHSTMISDFFEKNSLKLIHYPGGCEVINDLLDGILPILEKEAIAVNNYRMLKSVRSYLLLFLDRKEEGLKISSEVVNDFQGDGNDVLYYINYAHALAVNGKPEEAIPLYREIVNISRQYNGYFHKSLLMDFKHIQKHGVSLDGIQSFINELEKDYSQNFRNSIYISAILPGSQADAIGLQVGDVLLNYDGREVYDIDDFIWGRNAESYYEGNNSHVLEIKRNTRVLSFHVKEGSLGAGLEYDY